MRRLRVWKALQNSANAVPVSSTQHSFGAVGRPRRLTTVLVQIQPYTPRTNTSIYVMPMWVQLLAALCHLQLLCVGQSLNLHLPSSSISRRVNPSGHTSVSMGHVARFRNERFRRNALLLAVVEFAGFKGFSSLESWSFLLKKIAGDFPILTDWISLISCRKTSILLFTFRFRLSPGSPPFQKLKKWIDRKIFKPHWARYSKRPSGNVKTGILNVLGRCESTLRHKPVKCCLFNGFFFYIF